ncbi:hypothetical protein CO057_02140 [Candidatus Uhrbacteria bacterium CG_4_9_14_0_2_um_filter_41_50]|uniref:Uncharacterized protein n=1 Tax=Candidatus Uhrbacteria bacterium CG_4_9_14_0_2_um_filter_41_50 TaxID=1975031 RepID=A0A2M8EPI4_9BACT|nr:MAG: hypothetical protein COZ45_04185 [Candidatus Uhrbacteria bacterium CG_4_10_14_3_um_filter_41_21]PIZ54619.1 MAG: hypothetical protein COY24_03250 [Candidatus Uhrbacteria bacterium CG_4_10_14_0_2_um_filter_41_21]PJB84260.1 MAG: hypothetical protein CO086_04610 [Candidatus Uhrbacteria bacterium CG_4_9_14_0_8_um_filter_41_16]PJC24587.1 MAG: hypothetical protein CO057_02140 [Candidatus Uhrbacteria bacterium CG_4_9_14_0_2_um_filter_41_50]PJE74888.1 MAG: hypothetical protein COV03_03115 [Candi
MGESGNIINIFERPDMRERLLASLQAMHDGLPEKTARAFIEFVKDRLVSDLGTEVGDEFAEHLAYVKDDQSRDDLLNNILDFFAKHVDPDKFEAVERKKFVERGNFIPLNEILSFGADDGVAHIHLAPARAIAPEKRMQLLNGGLRELALRMNTDEQLSEISRVKATSWIVAKMPSIIESLGFHIDGPIDDEIRRLYFPDQKGEIWEAHMDRKEFLEIYLDKDL